MAKATHPIIRFFRAIQIVDATGCWEWTKSTDKDGYGWFTLGKYPSGKARNMGAHRASHLLFKGPIPEGYDIDHFLFGEGLCIGPSCANPQHLVAKTRQQHGLDTPTSITALNKVKTHCKRGHEFTEENIYWFRCGNGWGRSCRECSRIHARKAHRVKVGWPDELLDIAPNYNKTWTDYT